MTDDLFSVKDKIILVTGSSRGIGFTIANGLAKAGAKIILNGTDEGRLINAAYRLEKEINIKVEKIVFDIQDEKAIANAIQLAETQIGPIDVLINNAGIQIRGPLEEFKSDDWNKILGINLSGAFFVSKAIVPQMIDRKKGKIINICSIQSELARPTIAPYTASKGGLKMLTQGMATDWGKHNIQVNGIAPGYFKTDLTKSLYEDEKFDAWLCARVPANRWGNPEELIGAAIFLSAKASDYVNGHLIFVDGGLKACV